MTKLEKSLANWVSLGFIDQRQANTIQQYETSHHDSSWIIYGLLVLGASIIGIGVISLIAANWENISDAVKLFTDFAILSIMAMFIVHTFSQNKEIQFEILLLSFMLFCLASIGLIAQIYNTGGELYQMLMLWSVITFPLTIFTRSKLIHMVIPFMWLGGFLTALASAMLYSALIIPYFHYNVFVIAMTITLLIACLIQLGNRLSFAEGFMNALRVWFFISGLIAVIMSEFILLEYQSSQFDKMTPYYPGYILAILAAIAIINCNTYNKAQKSILLLTMTAFIASFHINMILPNSSLIYAVFTITILSLMAIFFASIHQRRLFNLLLLLTGIRFLILYFQALGGLATTGIGLIISGLIIIGMTYYWTKYRSDLANWAERWIQ